jgi:hypothetical protein
MEKQVNFIGSERCHSLAETFCEGNVGRENDLTYGAKFLMMRQRVVSFLEIEPL